MVKKSTNFPNYKKCICLLDVIAFYFGLESVWRGCGDGALSARSFL